VFLTEVLVGVHGTCWVLNSLVAEVYLEKLFWVLLRFRGFALNLVLFSYSLGLYNSNAFISGGVEPI